jgi:glycerol-3-phosphate acyltransferase PlsY
MAFEHVGRWAVIPVIIFDLGKAALPTWLGLYLGLGMPVAVTAGMAAVIGHSWPVFWRFHGGRGMGTFAGILLVVFPWGLAWLVALVALGWRLGDSAPMFLVSLITMPLLAYIVKGPEIVAWLCGAVLITTLIKRLEANRRPLPRPGPERRRVLLRRLFLDRDIANHEDWIRRGPDLDPRTQQPE